jgi:signal transduction histidine kinase/CheY-like chemotaxis protein/HPt (histidine-containing phosphotransfer) domain-containing protein
MKNTKAYGAEIQDELRETAPEYEKWRRRLFIMNCVIATGVFLLEIGVNIILFVQGKVNPDIVYHLMRYLVVPSGLVFLAVLFDGIMMRCFPNKDWLLNYIMVLTVVFMCTVVAVTHYVFPITMTAFVIPVLMSVVFGNNCMTAATAASCSVCVILTGIWRNIDGTDTDRYYVVQEVVISLGIIFVSLIVAGIVNSLITEQNHRLLDALRKEKRSQQEAEAANMAKSSFLANMSHEIRTPINAILGMNEMILREEKDPAIRGYAGNIQASGNSLLSIVSDVLDISKIESGKLEIIPVDYEVNSLISDCCNMAAGRAKAKELELLVECADNVPMKLCGDETHIRQIIMNLLTNAVKYTEKGTVKLIVSGRFTDGGFVLKVDVSDTGIGIAEENLPQLFTQFQRFDLQRNRNIEGTGLGLSIVKRLCDLMSGTITARSVLGSGSTFTVELPQKVVDSTPCGGVNLNYSAGAEHEYHHSFEAPEAKILAVDDLPVNLLVIANLLKETRIKIDTAGSGRECLDKCSQQKYDLILMDHMMPEMDGVLTFEKLHGDKSSPNFETPVIMLTANALAGMREQYMDVGFADYVSKPVRGAKLEEAIRRNLPESLIKPASPEIPAEAVSTEPSGFADICGAVPELNVNAALQYCCGSAELLNDLLHDFTENDHFSDLKAAFEEKRWEDYRRHAHSLKSTSLMIGLTGLSERARASELALKGGCTEFAELNHDSLIEEYSALLGKIKDYLKDKRE